MRFKRYICFVSLITAFQSFPSQSEAGDYAADYLNIGVGARGLALGGAYIALTRDVTAFYYNPAGLSYLKKPRVEFMYASQFGSLAKPLARYNHVGFAIPLPRNATVAVNWLRFAADDIAVYGDLQGENIGQRLRNPNLQPTGDALGSFSNTENAYFFSFSKFTEFDVDFGYQSLSFPLEIPFGVNFKMLQGSSYEATASGVGFDVGLMLRFGLAEMFNHGSLGKLSFGFQLKDVSETSYTWNDRTTDPIREDFNWGFAYEHAVNFLNGNVTFTWQDRSHLDKHTHFGAELSNQSLFLRMGSSDGTFTAGTGMVVWKVKQDTQRWVRLDYAFVGYDLGNVHRLSGVFQF